MEENFTPKQVAIAMQVSESSVKRWCDRGEIRTNRTLGGHRRIPLGFLLEFLESTDRELAKPEAIGLRVLEGEITRNGVVDISKVLTHFEQAMLDGAESECRQIVCTWFSTQGGIASLADDLISPVFRSVGAGWECGQVEIYEERHACLTTIKLVNELRRLIPKPCSMAPIAMGGAIAGDHNQLGTFLVEMVLLEQGWRSTNLGCNIPFVSLLSAARKYMPKVFWLSISHVGNEAEFLKQYNDFATRLPKGTLLVLGGQALVAPLREKMIYSQYCGGMKQLASYVKELKTG